MLVSANNKPMQSIVYLHLFRYISINYASFFAREMRVLACIGSGRSSACAVFAATVLLLTAFSANAEGLARPSGPVVVTITGDISETNRPAYDAKLDLFFKYHEKEFTRAAAFDYGMLEAIGTTKMVIRMPGDPTRRELEGVKLDALLDVVGAKTRGITAVALDGFGVEIGTEELDGRDWLVAFKENGRYLGIGQRGPLWLVFSPAAENRMATEEEEGRWPWATFLITVEDVN